MARPRPRPLLHEPLPPRPLPPRPRFRLRPRKLLPRPLNTLSSRPRPLPNPPWPRPKPRPRPRLMGWGWNASIVPPRFPSIPLPSPGRPRRPPPRPPRQNWPLPRPLPRGIPSLDITLGLPSLSNTDPCCWLPNSACTEGLLAICKASRWFLAEAWRWAAIWTRTVWAVGGILCCLLIMVNLSLRLMLVELFRTIF